MQVANFLRELRCGRSHDLTEVRAERAWLVASLGGDVWRLFLAEGRTGGETGGTWRKRDGTQSPEAG